MVGFITAIAWFCYCPTYGRGEHPSVVLQFCGGRMTIWEKTGAEMLWENGDVCHTIVAEPSKRFSFQPSAYGRT
jgi:hypothetical protein